MDRKQKENGTKVMKALKAVTSTKQDKPYTG
jgi:hypothetical protein